MQVYNNIATSSVWKNYTSNAEYLRKSITKLTGEAQEKKNVQDAPNETDLADSQILRARYRETANNAFDVERMINRLQTVGAWLQRADSILQEMQSLAVAADAEGDDAALQGRAEALQAENIRTTGIIRENWTGSQLFAGYPCPVDGDWSIKLRTAAESIINPEKRETVKEAVAEGMNALRHWKDRIAQAGGEAEALLTELRSHVENIRSTESSIRASDVAVGETQQAKYTILTQLGTAVLAQANAMPVKVLDLVNTQKT